MELEIRIVPPKGRIVLARPLAELRSAYFSGYPYLQEPQPQVTRNEMRWYCMDQNALIVAAFDGEMLVGAIISVSILPDVPTPYDGWFARKGIDRTKWLHSLYTLTVPEYRSRGVNAAMGSALNDEAIRLGFEGRVALMIVRPDGDTKAPAGYRSPLGFFLKRGYEQIDEPVLIRSWRDIGDDCETEKGYALLARRLTDEA